MLETGIPCQRPRMRDGVLMSSHDIFICYSARDKTVANAICAVLEAEGIRCWIAPRDIVPGADWGESIIDAINDAQAMVLVFSSNANEAQQQIKREVERAVNKGIPVVPFRIENVLPTKALEYFLSTPHWLDAFTPPLDGHVRELADSIKRLMGKQAARAAQADHARHAAGDAAEPGPAPLRHHGPVAEPAVHRRRCPAGMGQKARACRRSWAARRSWWWDCCGGISAPPRRRKTSRPGMWRRWRTPFPPISFTCARSRKAIIAAKAKTASPNLKAEVDAAFAKAKQANTAAAYQEFLNTYQKQGIDLEEARDAYANADAQENAVRTAYRRALATRTREGYQAFMAQFGASDLCRRCAPAPGRLPHPDPDHRRGAKQRDDPQRHQHLAKSHRGLRAGPQQRQPRPPKTAAPPRAAAWRECGC